VIYIVWFLVGIGLLAELHSAAFYAVFLGVGAFAAGILAFVVPDNSNPPTV
jgi:membrane protein implicated in regulation of membrane protease activity